jgi:hypothetical protein
VGGLGAGCPLIVFVWYLIEMMIGWLGVAPVTATCVWLELVPLKVMVVVPLKLEQLPLKTPTWLVDPGALSTPKSNPDGAEVWLPVPKL